ncbi:MAG: discoidin domain-containing protein [Candidatus Zixiibacteriota bacterium]|nr:MAG: discoidin domain-containing protein [candidate division Zixibacteria bacterium]
MGTKLSLTLVVALIICSNALATTYYVSKEATSGDGRSWATAWNTIQDVNNGMSSGDTVFFGTGTWIGTQLRCVAGTFSDRTVYACSSFADTNFQGEYHFAKIWGASSLSGANQNVIQCHYDNNSRLSYVTLWGLELAYGRPRVISIYGVTVDSFFVDHCKLVGCTSSEYNNPSLWHSGTMVGSEGSYNRLLACSLSTAYGPGGGHGCGIDTYSQNDMTVDSCVFYGHFDGACLWWKNDNDGLNYRNIVKNSIFTPTSADYGGGVWLYRNQNNDSVYNNVFAGGLTRGVRIGNHTSRPNNGTVIINNTFINCAGLGGDRNCIDGYNTTGTVYKYNVEYRTSTPFQVIGECLDASDLDVDSNIYVAGSAQAEYGYANYVTQSYWMNTLGHDRNSAFWPSVSNIGFADYNNGDYTRSPDSVEMTAYYDGRTWLYYGASLVAGPSCPPPPPPSLAGPSNGSSGLEEPILLAWNSSSGADNYQVQVDDIPYFANQEVNQQTAGLTYSVTGLAEGTTYYWRVRAADTCGWGAWSQVWSFTTAGEGSGTSNLALGITPSVDGTYSGYSVSTITDGVVDPFGGTATTWASYESATQPHWIEVDFGGSKVVQQVRVLWAWSSNRNDWMTSQQYHIQRWNGTDWVDVTVVNNAGADSVTVTSFPSVTTSRLRIYQPTNMGPSDYPTVIWLTELEEIGSTPTEIDTIPPGGIDDLGAAPGEQHGEIQLTWTAPGDDGFQGVADRYEIMCSEGEILPGDWSPIAILHDPLPAGNPEEFVVSGLLPGRIYNVAVKAFDEAANDPGLSNIPQSFAGGIRPPPWLFTSVDEAGQSATLTCSTVVSYFDVDTYRFVLVDSSSGDSTFLNSSDLTTGRVSVTFSSLDEQSLYYWNGKAVATGADSSAWSMTKKFRLSNVCPDPPRVSFPPDRDTVFTSNTTLDLVVRNGTDDDSSGVMTYDFELYDVFGDNLLASRTNVEEGDSVTSWGAPVDPELGLSYIWRVRSFDGLDYSFWMDWSEFTVFSAGTGGTDGPTIIAYPNPVYFTQGEYVTFTLPEDPVDLLIMTVSGETVLLETGISGNYHWYGQNESGNTVSIGIYAWSVRGTGQRGKIVVKP